MRKLLEYPGYGIIIWIIAFVVSSIFIAFETTETLRDTVTTLVVIVAVFLLARNLYLGSRKELFLHGLTWMVMVLVLDVLITVRFTGWQFLASWLTVVAYLLIVLVPLLSTRPKGKIW